MLGIHIGTTAESILVRLSGHSKRARLTTTSLVCALSVISLVSAASATASTTIGQVDPGTPSTSCVTSTRVQGGLSGGVPSYTVAASGVITAWSTKANASAGRELGLRVFRPTGSPTDFIYVGGTGGTGVETLTANTLNVFATRVVVQAGDVLGARTGNPGGFPISGGAACAIPGSGSDDFRSSATDPTVGSTVTFGSSNTGYRMNLTALIEADADGDGYGDETQDSCPTNASTQGICPTSTPPADNGTVPVDADPPTGVVTPGKASIVSGALVFRLTSNETATATMSGTIDIPVAAKVYRLKAATVALEPNVTRSVKLRIPRAARRRCARYLRTGRGLQAKVVTVLKDSSGNSQTVRTTVTLRK